MAPSRTRLVVEVWIAIVLLSLQWSKPAQGYPRPLHLSPFRASASLGSSRRRLLDDDPAYKEINSRLGINPRIVPFWGGYLMFPEKMDTNRSRPRRVMINFAQGCCAHAQYRNCASGVRYGADMCIAHNISSLPQSFMDRNKEILGARKGHGYWSWKPYFIYRTLTLMEEGDYVIYSDSAQDVIDDLGPLCEQALPDRPLFEFFPATNKYYTKQDAYLLMNCTNNTMCAESRQVQASFFVFRKSTFSLSIVAKWLAYAQDVRVITDKKSTLKDEDSAVFHQHRHDQSIVTLLFQKSLLTPPRLKGCQWKEFMCRIDHHRRRD